MRVLNNGAVNALARYLAGAHKWVTSWVDRYNAAADYAALSDLSDAALRKRDLSRSSLAHDLTSPSPSGSAKDGTSVRAPVRFVLGNAGTERSLRTGRYRLAAMGVIFAFTCLIFAYSLLHPRPSTTAYEAVTPVVGP